MAMVATDCEKNRVHPEHYFPHCLGLRVFTQQQFTIHSILELGLAFQTARIGLNADLSTVGWLVAGTLQFIGHKRRAPDSGKALPALCKKQQGTE
jgi:hypothetical protein